jgi:diguanylate cyclase (GGDEF)-like protein
LSGVTEIVTCPVCGGSGVVDPVSEPADDRTLDDHDQTASDHDQTSADRDQTWADHDQTASDRDQQSSDEDQQASDEDFAAGSDSATHQRTTSARARATSDREAVSELRDETGTTRFQTAEERDRAAEFRDRGAEGRDRLARLHDQEDDTDASTEDILLRAERDRSRAAADRAKAADDRSRATADREEAARERAEALRASAEARYNLVIAATDELTGAWTRKFGLADIAREIERARRTGGRLMLAFIDVDGLKEVNDSQGHPAGDGLLRLVVKTLRANVRPYDVIVRYGGDEFLCAMPDLTRAAAKVRMEKIAAALTAADAQHSITFGLAEHEPVDGLKELIGRADADLLEARSSREAHQ